MTFYVQPVDKKVFNKVLKVLGEIEPDVKKQLKEELVTKLQSTATSIAQQMPVEPPLSGLGVSPTYKQPRASISFTPGSRQTRLVSILLNAGTGRGFYIAELAGTITTGLDNRGRALIRNLDNVQKRRGKGGRFAWPAFVEKAPEMSRIAEQVIDKKLAELEKKIS